MSAPSSYGPFPYSPIVRRPTLAWPDGARVALWFVPNVEYVALDDPSFGPTAPDVPAWARRDYGNRVGIFRLMEVMDRYGIRGTATLNSAICAHHPAIVAEGEQRGWEWLGHNETNAQRLNALPPEDEAAVIGRALTRIEATTGRRPAGWISSGAHETWRTLEHLAAAGITYVGDWANDDQPYPIELGGGRRLISLPYSLQVNDKPLYERFGLTPDEFRDVVCRQFDVLYREGATSGRTMSIGIHPDLSGQPFRIGAVDAILAHICAHDGVWHATGSEIVAHYARTLAP